MEKRKKHIEKYVAAGLSVFLTFAALMGTSCEVKDNG